MVPSKDSIGLYSGILSSDIDAIYFILKHKLDTPSSIDWGMHLATREYSFEYAITGDKGW
jgi:hypothetical protein